MSASSRRWPPRRPIALWFALAAILAVALSSLVWLAFRSVAEWQRSTIQLVNQRSEEALTLLSVALSRDMRGVHDSVLAPFNEGALDLGRRYELENLFAQAFARFPYPESFFVWREGDAGRDAAFIFNRVDRQPPWDADRGLTGAYPVVSLPDPPVARDLVLRAIDLGGSRQRFGSFETSIGGQPYQVVVHLLYHTTGDRRMFGGVGFTVNLEWVRGHYFGEILQQISRIGNVEDSIMLAVVDDRGAAVASTKPGNTRASVLHARRLPFSFLDQDLIAEGSAAPAIPAREWTLSASAVDEGTLAAVARGYTNTRWLIVLSAAAALTGLLLTIGALKASATLTDMQSEFIASATHELKTPLALFHLVADTLAQGRYESAETVRTYGTLLANQSDLLERLIDNLLAYASLSDVSQRYTFQPQSVSGLVDAALERFDARLATTGTEVKVELPTDLPPVRGDRATLLQVLDNVIDNALKYAPTSDIVIRGRARGRDVQIEIVDHGRGIPADEREKVFQKFYRGQKATSGGTGLGLAIAQRVVRDHGGRISIQQSSPSGTTVDITLPAFADATT
jgi:signal transduction histidine kinase